MGLALAAPLDIPGATFRMGSGRAPDERPVRDVALSPYRIDRAEVTLAAFDAFVEAAGYAEVRWWSEAGWAWARDHVDGAGAALRSSGRPADHPVVAVTWFEADAYCRWRGGALPTEAQWEHAACHDDQTRYPWGEAEDFRAVWYNEGKFGQVEGVRTAPAETQEPALASPFGLVHTAGNVWEWTSDAYDARWYGATSAAEPQRDPVNAEDRPWKTLRGGSFANLASYCTCTHREPARPEEARLTAGFRCAYPPP